jgi:hypothetical protein
LAQTSISGGYFEQTGQTALMTACCHVESKADPSLNDKYMEIIKLLASEANFEAEDKVSILSSG